MKGIAKIGILLAILLIAAGPAMAADSDIIQSPPRYGRADFKEIFWFAPEVKRHMLYLYEARWETRISDTISYDSKTYYESLKSYKVSK